MDFWALPLEARLAWAAGLFEGEGCITQNRGRPKLQLTMTDEDVVRRFHAVVGMGKVGGPWHSASRGPNRKPSWMWDLHGYAKVGAALELLGPFLCSRRTERMKEVLHERESADKA